MNNRTGGFSLIELIVVIAIIGILAAIAVPNYRAYRERAKVLSFLDLVGSYKTEIEKYYATKGVLPPAQSFNVPASWPGTTISWSGPVNVWGGIGHLTGYVNSS